MRRPLTWLSWSALVAVFAVATFTRSDPDLWGHLRFGLDMLRTHAVPSIDPYSFTQDRPWINHEWLSELAMALSYRALGVAGLTLLKGALATTAFLLIWGAYRGAAFEARVAAVLLAVLGILPLARTLRPQLWTVVCLALLLRALARSAPGRRWWLPVLFVVWANVHGGWVVGLGVLAVWLTVESLHDVRRALPAAALGASCVLATLATPYGWTLWRFVAETVHVTRPNIEDWAPLWSFGPSQWLIPAIVAAAVIWLSSRPSASRWTRLAVLALLAYGAVRVARIAPLFVEASALLLAPVIIARWPAKAFQIRSEAERVLIVVATGVMACGGGVVLAVAMACIPADAATRPDGAAISALRLAPPGRLVLLFQWGEYALWHVGPAIRVSMDGRRETVYSDRRVQEHDAILAGSPDGLQTLELWRPEYVWLPASSAATRTWLVANGYRVDVETGESFLAVRQDLPHLVASRSASESDCFPQ